MKLSYIGKRASSATIDKERFAEARWKYGSRKDEEFGYIFRCLLDDNGYTYEVDTDRKTCWVKVRVTDYDKFIVIKSLYEEAKDAFRK